MSEDQDPADQSLALHSTPNLYCQPAGWAAFLLAIKFLPVAMDDIGMWWRLNFIRHFILSTSMLAAAVLQDHGCSPVGNALDKSDMHLGFLKVFAVAFISNTWLEVGGRLRLPCWLLVNAAVLVKIFWLCNPDPDSNQFMQQVVPHLLGSTVAVLCGSTRQAWALQRFLQSYS